jgi:broad specificity phosphatase PhoE
MRYLYHCTPADRMPSIQKIGLRPSEDSNWGGEFEASSLGRVFLADTPEHAYYFGEIIFRENLRGLGVAFPPVVLRTRAPRDAVRSAEDEHEFSVEREIPPQEIDVLWHGWRPIGSATPDWEDMGYRLNDDEGVYEDWEGTPFDSMEEVLADAKGTFLSPASASPKKGGTMPKDHARERGAAKVIVAVTHSRVLLAMPCILSDGDPRTIPQVGGAKVGEILEVQKNGGKWVMRTFQEASDLGEEDGYGTRPTVFFVRHGHTPFNSTTGDSLDGKIRGYLDIPLDDEGRKQAAEVAEKFEGMSVSELWSSDLGRATETAKEISEVTGRPVRPTKALRPCDWGDMNGKVVRDCIKKMEELQESLDVPAPGGETFGGFYRRAKQGVEMLLARAEGGTETDYPSLKGGISMDAKELSEDLAKTAGILCEMEPNADQGLQAIVGDPDDVRTSTFVQFKPNPGTMQLPNPLSPVEGDDIFFAYMIPGAKFQAHDGTQWNIMTYGAPDQIEIENVWYPREHAIVAIGDIRRSIDQWIEPVQQYVPAPPPGVDYSSLPVKVMDKDDNLGDIDQRTDTGTSTQTGGW